MTIYLLHITPYDPDASAEVDVRVSMGSLTPKFDGVHWPARLISPPDVLVSVFQREAFGDRNPPRTVLGPAVVDLRDGSLDAWRGYEFDGRAFTLYKGDDGETDFNNFTVAAAGVVDSVSWTREQMTLRLADYSVDLDQPAAQSYYTGAGGATGGSSDLTAQPRPRALGSPRNVTPTLLDATRQIYQVNDGDVNDITDVYDGGVALTSEGDTDMDDVTYISARLDDLVINLLPIVACSPVYGDSGSRAYVAGLNSDNSATILSLNIRDYSLASAVNTGDRLDLSGVFGSTAPTGIVFNSTGTRLIVAGTVSGLHGFQQYNLSTAWDITTASAVGSFVSAVVDLGVPASGGGGLTGVDGNADLSRIITCNDDEKVAQIDLSTPGDLSTATYTSGELLDCSPPLSTSNGLRDAAFADSGDLLFIWGVPSGGGSPTAYKYTLSTPYDITTGTLVTPDLYRPINNSIEGQSGAPRFSPDGTSWLAHFNSGSAEPRRVFEARPSAAFALDGSNSTVQFGRYRTDLSTGRFRVAGPPQFGITADVEGELDGSIFLESAADIAEYLLEEAIGSARVDSASFATVKAANSATASLYIPTDERPKYSDIIPDILASIGVVLRPSSDGKIGAQILEIGTPTLTLREDDIIAGSFARTEPPRPIYRMTIGYEKNWTLQRGSEINADEITAADRQFRESEYRSTSAESAAVETRFLRSRTSTFNTLLDTQSAASTEASRRLTLTGTRRDFYVFNLFARQYEVRAGDTITIIHPDTRTPAGLDVLVQSVEERANGRTRIVVWG